ncbi:hypothetical protein BJ741DRAFT_614200 [Chytriomyces cf. hyalinus JEL632]|nr:hypothetical protein BJ741DRAFT_614200 [Chytriomyces cf. hyalinus JEL632]
MDALLLQMMASLHRIETRLDAIEQCQMRLESALHPPDPPVEPQAVSNMIALAQPSSIAETPQDKPQVVSSNMSSDLQLPCTATAAVIAETPAATSVADSSPTVARNDATNTFPVSLIVPVFSRVSPEFSVRHRRISRAFNNALSSSEFAQANISRHCTRKSGSCWKRADSFDELWFHVWPESFQLAYADLVLGDTARIDNMLCSGSIPGAIGRMRNLKRIHWADCFLSGAIPDTIGQLTNLVSLNIGENQLTGIIPGSIANLSNLTFLHLGGNPSLDPAPIPDSFSFLKRLKQLYLYNSNRVGSLPEWLSAFDDLEHLELAQNQLTGVVTSDLAAAFSRLGKLTLDADKFTLQRDWT